MMMIMMMMIIMMIVMMMMMIVMMVVMMVVMMILMMRLMMMILRLMMIMITIRMIIHHDRFWDNFPPWTTTQPITLTRSFEMTHGTKAINHVYVFNKHCEYTCQYYLCVFFQLMLLHLEKHEGWVYKHRIQAQFSAC